MQFLLVKVFFRNYYYFSVDQNGKQCPIYFCFCLTRWWLWFFWSLWGKCVPWLDSIPLPPPTILLWFYRLLMPNPYYLSYLSISNYIRPTQIRLEIFQQCKYERNTLINSKWEKSIQWRHRVNCKRNDKVRYSGRSKKKSSRMSI